MYKVSMQSKGEFKPEQYKGKSVVLLISVGKEYHEGDKLLATIKKINNAKFSHCLIAVADTLQRYNLDDEDDAYYLSHHMGSDWIKRNEETLRMLDMEYNIKRWDQLINRDDYASYKNAVIHCFLTNKEYRDAIESTINTFAQRKNIDAESVDYGESFYRSLFYILEECPIIMPMWGEDKFDYIIYPKPMTNAMQLTRELLVKDKKYANWISLRFKKKRSLIDSYNLHDMMAEK